MRDASKPTEFAANLTLREARERWPRLYPELVYAAVGVGLLHAVKERNYGWTVYPEWELEWLSGELEAGKSLPQIVFEADRAGRIVVDSLEVPATRSSLKHSCASSSRDFTEKWAA